MSASYSWILDSGGAGRGAWQGGVIHEFMRWCREHGSFPLTTMGASVGGYAAADVATGTEKTVMKGWNYWGGREKDSFRNHLRSSIDYVMEEDELAGVFDGNPERKLLVFTTRVRSLRSRPFGSRDRWHYFLKSVTRKLPGVLKYTPRGYIENPVVFATHLPAALQSEYVRPLTRENYRSAIEASCLVPVAMGAPLEPAALAQNVHDGDRGAVFMDGGYSLKMPMRLFEEDSRFKALGEWVRADKTIVFCCDPKGKLWETSARRRLLNKLPSVALALAERRLLVIHPDHKVEAGFLCMDHETTMDAFRRGQEQAERLLRSDTVRRFFET